MPLNVRNFLSIYNIWSRYKQLFMIIDRLRLSQERIHCIFLRTLETVILVWGWTILLLLVLLSPWLFSRDIRFFCPFFPSFRFVTHLYVYVPFVTTFLSLFFFLSSRSLRLFLFIPVQIHEGSIIISSGLRTQKVHLDDQLSRSQQTSDIILACILGWWLSDKKSNETWIKHKIHIHPTVGSREKSRSISSNSTHQRFLSSRMKWQIGGDIVYLSIDSSPGVISLIMLLEYWWRYTQQSVDSS